MGAAAFASAVGMGAAAVGMGAAAFGMESIAAKTNGDALLGAEPPGVMAIVATGGAAAAGVGNDAASASKTLWRRCLEDFLESFFASFFAFFLEAFLCFGCFFLRQIRSLCCCQCSSALALLLAASGVF